MTSPARQRPRCRLPPEKISGNVGIFALPASQGGPSVFAPLVRTAGATMCKTRQAAIRRSVPVSFFRRVIWSPPARVAFRPQRSGQDLEFSSRAALPIQVLIFDPQDLSVNIARREKLVWRSIQTYCDPCATAARDLSFQWRVKLSNEAGQECAASADVRASPWEQSAMRRIAPCVLRDGRRACPRAAPRGPICSHYAAALRKYWEIPACRRAIA